MAEVDALVQQAAAAFKAGRKDQARALLLQAVEKDDHHEQAWLWLSGVVSSLEEQQICLENVLQINPANDRARRGLESINQKIAAQNRNAPPQTPSPAQDTSTESWFAAPASPAGGSSDFGLPETSVDWSKPDAPAVHGSGQKVALPSSQEYDQWVQNLNLTNEWSSPAPSDSGTPADAGFAPFVMDAPSPFGDEPFSAEPEPFAPDRAAPRPPAAPPPARRPEPPEDSRPAKAPPPAPRAEVPSPAFTLESLPGFDVSELRDEDPFADLPAETEPAPDSSPFGAPFETASPVRFDFDEELPRTPAFEAGWADDLRQAALGYSAPVFAGPDEAGAAQANASEYFDYIPAEIEARSGGVARRSLLLLAGIVVLVILNVISFVALLSSV